jgi:hypothetical protein
MTETIQLVADGVLAGWAILASIALVVLFRRVASLRRATSTSSEVKDLGEKEQELHDEAPGAAKAELPTRSFWQQPYPGAVARPETPEPTAAPKPVEETRRTPEAIFSFARVVADYNALAANFSQAHLQAFEERWQPRTVARAADNWLSEDPQGEFWVIPGDAGGPLGLLVPGSEVVRKWELYYRSMDSLAAKNLLETIYEVRSGAPLRLNQPAIAAQTEKGWKVETPGTLADV